MAARYKIAMVGPCRSGKSSTLAAWRGEPPPGGMSIGLELCEMLLADGRHLDLFTVAGCPALRGRPDWKNSDGILSFGPFDEALPPRVPTAHVGGFAPEAVWAALLRLLSEIDAARRPRAPA